MKRRILLISDYVEGLPVIASVRYEQLMKYITSHFDVVVASNSMYGENTRFACEHLLFRSVSSRYTVNFKEGEEARRGRLESILRRSLALKKIWKRCQKSPLVFRRRNREFCKQMGKLLRENPVDAVLATVPELEALYAALWVKSNFKSIPLICEMRDILDSDIWKDRAVRIVRRAEREMAASSNGVIALSEGIANHYEAMTKDDVSLAVIRNGYEESDFEWAAGAVFDGRELEKKGCIKFLHMGSIYEGRNVSDFLEGLLDFQGKTGIKAEFEVVGYADLAAVSDMERIAKESGGSLDVKLLGGMSHRDAIERLRDCDVAVILTHRKGSEYAIPGKTFEYIGAAKPVIAVSTDKELVEIVAGRYGECAGHSPSEVSAALFRLLGANYEYSGREEFSRSEQAERIVSFIESVIRESKREV